MTPAGIVTNIPVPQEQADIVIDHGDQSGTGRPAVDSDIDQAAMRLARKLSTSIRIFPGVVIEMTRIDQGRWRNNMKLMDKR